MIKFTFTPFNIDAYPTVIFAKSGFLRWIKVLKIAWEMCDVYRRVGYKIAFEEISENVIYACWVKDEESIPFMEIVVEEVTESSDDVENALPQT